MESEMREEIRPCPFCGSRDVDTIVGSVESYVVCGDCSATGPLSDNEAEAIELWNSVDAPRAKVQRLEGDLRRYRDKCEGLYHSMMAQRSLSEELSRRMSSVAGSFPIAMREGDTVVLDDEAVASLRSALSDEVCLSWDAAERLRDLVMGGLSEGGDDE